MKFHQCKKLFSNYAESYLTGDVDFDRNIWLKHDHTFRVTDLAAEIVSGIGLSGVVSEASVFAALFHDVSRFEQFRRYGSYRDCAEFDHGEVSAAIFSDRFAGYTGLKEDDIRKVVEAVFLHNKKDIPPDSGMPVKIVRDADKLDVLEIILNELADPQDERVFYSLPDTGDITPEVLNYVFERQLAPHSCFRTLSDFIIAKVSWVYDLNTPVAAELFLKSDYLCRMRKYLRESKEVEKIFSDAGKYLEEFCN